MKKGVAYIRVSTEGQVDKYGLEAQLYDIQEYAKAHNIELVEIFREEGVSGAKDREERIALASMLDYCEDNPEIDCVIVPELSRLARDVGIQENIIKELKKYDVQLISLKEPDLGANDSYRKLIRQIIGAINEFEREMIAARMEAGRRAKARKGGHAAGRIPTGYKVTIDGNKKVLEKADEEAHIVHLIFELKDKRKMSYRAIADYLNEHGYKPKYAEKFGHTTVRKIYLNPKYKGVVKHIFGGQEIAATNENLRLVD